MRTIAINVTYTLDDNCYRAAVAAATGPVAREHTCACPVGDLTPEGRLALLTLNLAEHEHPNITWPRQVATAPTASEVSAELCARVATAASALAARVALVGAYLDQYVISACWPSWKLPGIDLQSDGCDCPVALRPRLDEIRARSRVLACEAAAEAAAREAAAARAAAAKAAAAKAAVAEAEASARTWVAEHGAPLSPELARAASEGRSVRSEITRLVSERVRAVVGALPGYSLDAIYGSEPRLGVPSAAAYALYDAALAAAAAMRDAAALPGAGVEIGEIERLDVAPHGAAVYRTGITITVRHPWITDPPIELYRLCEPFALQNSDDDDDDDDR